MKRFSRPPLRLVELGTAVGGAAGGLLRIVDQHELGFPDGYLTEFDRAMRVPHLVLAGLALVLAGALFWPGLRGRWVLVGALCVVLAVDGFGLYALGTALGLDPGHGG